MIKKLLTLSLILLLISISIFATVPTAQKISIKKDIKAIKYSTSDIFNATSADKAYSLEIVDDGNIQLPYQIDISHALDTEIKAFNYKISGNIKEPITVKFTFSRLAADRNYINYNVRVVPQTAVINNLNFDTRLVTASHMLNSINYYFKYKNSQTLTGPNATIYDPKTYLNINKDNMNISIKYTTNIDIQDGNGKNVTNTIQKQPAIVDHWIRQGAVYIKVPSDANNIQTGTYTSIVRIEVTGV